MEQRIGYQTKKCFRPDRSLTLTFYILFELTFPASYVASDIFNTLNHKDFENVSDPTNVWLCLPAIDIFLNSKHSRYLKKANFEHQLAFTKLEKLLLLQDFIIFCLKKLSNLQFGPFFL